MSTDTWTTRAAELIRRIAAPDLDEREIVILDANENGDAATMLPTFAAGFTCSWLPTALGTDPQGFAAVVNPSRRWHEPLRADIYERLGIYITLHELCHHFDSDVQTVRPTPTPEQREALLKFLAEPGIADALVPIRAPWHHHEVPFIRAGLHIAHRAFEFGFTCSPTNLDLAGERYGLSPAGRYAEALGNEPADRQHEPLSVVLASPAPEAFTELFAADCARWRDTQNLPARRG